MDILKQYIETAQGKTSQEKHSIALIVAGAISGVLFVIWISFALYFLRTTDTRAVQTQPLQQMIIPTGNEEALNGQLDSGATGETTYTDIDSVPAVYRPDAGSQGTLPPALDSRISDPTSTTQETSVQGSDSTNPVVE